MTFPADARKRLDKAPMCSEPQKVHFAPEWTVLSDRSCWDEFFCGSSPSIIRLNICAAWFGWDPRWQHLHRVPKLPIRSKWPNTTSERVERHFRAAESSTGQLIHVDGGSYSSTMVHRAHDTSKWLQGRCNGNIGILGPNIVELRL